DVPSSSSRRASSRACGVAEAWARLVLGRQRRGVKVPDLPLAPAAAVVPPEDTRLAEAHGHDVAAAAVERDDGVEECRAGALRGTDRERENPLCGHVGHVAVYRDAYVPQLGRLGRDEVLLVVLEQAHLPVEAVVGVAVDIPHQVLGREAFAHPLDVEPDVRLPPLPMNCADLALIGVSVAHDPSFRSSASTTGSTLAAESTRSSRLTKPAHSERSDSRSPLA